MKKHKPVWIACGLFGVLFMLLLSIRMGVFQYFLASPRDTVIRLKNPSQATDSWLNILQNESKIGYLHTNLSKVQKGYKLLETMHIRINTMGMVQDINFDMEGRLNLDYTLSSFDFTILSGRFRFQAMGTVAGDMLSIKTQSADGSSHHVDIKIKEKIYATSGILRALEYDQLDTGKTFTFHIFDPITMSHEPIHIKVVGEEEIVNMGITKHAKKLKMIFKGATQQVWIGKANEIIREQGMLGISFERASRENALFDKSTASSQDLTQLASVPSNVKIKNAKSLKRLELEIDGIAHNGISLNGGRQRFKGNVLVISKERLTELPSSSASNDIKNTAKEFLKPSQFVQSDNPKIRNLVNKVVSRDDNLLQRAKKIIAWIHNHIEKRPVLSLPDALSTLSNRVGDCNEHAVLMAALARAAGIPTKIETGLVYLNGRFYYHAWNLLYLGEWITADSLFNQIPADVTHIRMTSGGANQHLDLMKVIGKIKLRVVKQTK